MILFLHPYHSLYLPLLFRANLILGADAFGADGELTHTSEEIPESRQSHGDSENGPAPNPNPTPMEEVEEPYPAPKKMPRGSAARGSKRKSTVQPYSDASHEHKEDEG